MSTLAIFSNRASRRMQDAAETRDDDWYVARVIGGEQESFQPLIDRYAGRIHTLVRGMIRDRDGVEDVVQDVFFKAYRKLDTFERKSSFYTWIYRIAVNTATDWLKRRRSDKSRSLEDYEGFEPVAPAVVPGEDVKRVELRQRLAEAMAELHPRYRDVLVLREYEECSYEKIAEILGCSIGTVESRLFRARARLREKLKRYLK